ncbi:uncharacterized protein [Henckelia pumila]|uniref:uncharacterized protein n=1 Tax=Henckelia pumila TaxID=405737 RepID=UPI003C6E9EF9
MIICDFNNRGIESSKGQSEVDEIRSIVLSKIQNEEGKEDCVDSDKLNSQVGSDDEEFNKYVMFDPVKDGKNPELKLGMIFSSREEAKFAIDSHCIRNGMTIIFVKNDKLRLRGWLAKTFAKKFKSNPKLGTSEFRKEVNSTLKVLISRKQAYMAKRKAIDIMEGNIKEQFRKIRNYCVELKRVDEAATVILKLSEDSDGLRFQRMYVCFSACRDMFKKACRPLIGVDGCFLKGFEDQYAWTFMADKQKGLIPAFKSLFPDAENRFCVRHLHSNMKTDGFRGPAVKNSLWATAKAKTVADFRRKMEELKEIDEKAYEWLANKPVQHWYRSHFTTFPKCDILLNNMCECFNRYILDAREKAMIPMFESIQNFLMVRFQVNREMAEKCDEKLCPKIKKVLAKIYMYAARNFPMQADNTHFQIMGQDEQHTVDLGSRSCSCRKLDLTGIPCQHAVCAIWCNNGDPEDYVHRYYWIETYKRCYEKLILPINGPELWPECELPPPLPPVYLEKVGRPAKLRRRERDEPPASSQTKF